MDPVNECGMMYCCVSVCVPDPELSMELEPEQKAEESLSDEWCKRSLSFYCVVSSHLYVQQQPSTELFPESSMSRTN